MSICLQAAIYKELPQINNKTNHPNNSIYKRTQLEKKKKRVGRFGHFTDT